VQQTFETGEVTRDDLNSLVDRAADLIRTAVDYKFILVLLFLKRLNDLWKAEKLQVKARLVKESGLSEEEAGKEAEINQRLPPETPEQIWYIRLQNYSQQNNRKFRDKERTKNTDSK